MNVKEALAIIERYSILNEIGQDEMQQDFEEALSIIKQALTEQEKKDEFEIENQERFNNLLAFLIDEIVHFKKYIELQYLLTISELTINDLFYENLITNDFRQEYILWKNTKHIKYNE